MLVENLCSWRSVQKSQLSEPVQRERERDISPPDNGIGAVGTWQRSEEKLFIFPMLFHAFSLYLVQSYWTERYFQYSKPAGCFERHHVLMNHKPTVVVVLESAIFQRGEAHVEQFPFVCSHCAGLLSWEGWLVGWTCNRETGYVHWATGWSLDKLARWHRR